jgi:hypothetical protein
MASCRLPDEDSVLLDFCATEFFCDEYARWLPFPFCARDSTKVYDMLRIQLAACISAILLLAQVCLSADAVALPQPGPEVAGLRIRLMVEALHGESGDKFHTRLDLINVTDESIRLSADWPNHMKGSFREYMEAAASIRTYPDIVLWGIQVRATRQPAPRTEHTLGAGETLSVEWTTKGRRLKNRVIHPNSNRNPYFPSDGLYGVHAELALNVEIEPVDTNREIPPDRELKTERRPLRLRSNEQLVTVGGSNGAPKTAISVVQHVSDDFRTAQISVGSVEGIVKGDQFLARTGMSGLWKLTVSETHVGYSKVSVELGSFGAERPATPRAHEMLKAGTSIGLIPSDVEGSDWMWVHH